MTDNKNPDRLYSRDIPNTRNTPRCCAKCGKTGKGVVSRTDGSWRLSISTRHIMCDVCWDAKYFEDEVTTYPILQRDAEMIEVNGRQIRTHKKNITTYTCPISGESYKVLTSGGGCDMIFIETPPPGAGLSTNVDWPYMQSGTNFKSSRSGLFYVSDGVPVNYDVHDARPGALVEDAKRRQYAISFRNNRYLFKLEHCVQLECGKWVHVTERDYYAKRCSITTKVFYSTVRTKFSKEGEELMRRKDVFLCSSCGKPCKPEESMVRDGHLTCRDCASEAGSIYYDGAAYDADDKTGRTIGVELELEVRPEGQLRVQKIAGIEVQASDMLKRPCAMNLPPVSAHEDGSLRGKHPIEYVSPILYEGNYKRWVSNVCAAISGSTRVYSRAGLHAHFGTKDFSWLDIMNLGCHAQLFERLYASMVAPSRWHNPFVTHMPDFIHAASKITSKSEFMLWFYGKRELGIEGKRSRRANEMQNRAFPRGTVHRYQWLNLHSHVFRRTVEVRLHHATANGEKIVNWCDLWLNVINHIGRGGSWKVSPLDLAGTQLRRYYETRIGKFSAMVDPHGLQLDAIHPRTGIKRNRGLMSTDEKWAKEVAGESPHNDVVASRAAAMDRLARIRAGGCNPLEPPVRVPNRMVAGLVDYMHEWIDTTLQLHRSDEEDAPVDLVLVQQHDPGTRQSVVWHFEDGSTDVMRDAGRTIRAWEGARAAVGGFAVWGGAREEPYDFGAQQPVPPPAPLAEAAAAGEARFNAAEFEEARARVLRRIEEMQ